MESKKRDRREKRRGEERRGVEGRERADECKPRTARRVKSAQWYGASPAGDCHAKLIATVLLSQFRKAI